MSRLKKLEDFYNWLSRPCPVLIDIIAGGLAVLLAVVIVTLIGSLIWWMLGWYLFPIFLCVLLILVVVHLVYAHKECDGGIKGWWKDKP